VRFAHVQSPLCSSGIEVSSQNTYIIGKNLPAAHLKSELAFCAMNGDVIGIDTETEGINPKEQAAASGAGRIACWSISTPRYNKVFLWSSELENFKTYLEDPLLLKVGHNIFGFDYHMFLNHGIRLQGIIGDTLRMSRLIYSCKMRKHNLKSLAWNWLGIKQPTFASLFMRPKHRMEYVQEKRKRKGQTENLDYRETRKKVGETKGVPTLLASGERGIFGAALEFIPLSSIPEVYPERLEKLYEYATLDAQLTRLLYHEFKKKLKGTPWLVKK
jgi:hypothetical protein